MGLIREPKNVDFIIKVPLKTPFDLLLLEKD